jgi:salicylate hydroxylase
VPPAPPRIVIIGAGVGGLTLALLLRRQGLRADILEQATELREVGAAIALAANSTRVLRSLGLGDALAAAGTEATALIHRDGRDGRVISATPGGAPWYRDRFGAPFYGLHRAALQELLAAAVGPQPLHLGCQVTDLEERGSGVGVRTASGTVLDADLVVGADGVHSRVRAWVTGGDEPAYSGATGFRGLVPADRVPSLPDPGALQCWMGPGAHLLHYAISGGSVINFLAVADGPARWTGTSWMAPAEPGAHLAAFAGWHPAVTELLAAVPQSPRWALFARRPLLRWSRGPVVLLGDAAHAMLPHYGQGAGQTIEDAAVLAAELGRGDGIATALRRYERRRRARTRKVQMISWAASDELHLPDGPAARRRDAALPGLIDRIAWLHEYDALGPG